MSNTKPVHLLTLDPQRLARAGNVQRVSFTGRRRATQRAAALLLVGLALLSAITTTALSGARSHAAHAQTIGEPVCFIGAPTLPQSQPVVCLQPRAFIPIVMNTR